MNSSAEKNRRQRIILEILRSRHIANQSELERALLERGHGVTQSTLSRDLKDLRVLRVPGESGYRYVPAGERIPGSAETAMRTVAAAEVVQVRMNETVIVVRTQVARASGVASFLDGLQLDGVLATVAGDDAILVVPESIENTAVLMRRLRELFDLE